MADAMSDLVVLIPGIGGSVLRRNGRDIWSFAPGSVFRGVLSLGGSIKQLRLDGGDDPGLDDLGDGVEATKLLPDLHIVPGLDWKIDGYTAFRDQLLARFDCTPGKNYFEFAYDWRRDNRVAARKLARAASGWLRRWREESGNDAAQLILVGHSMGGIVARLFLELHEGWRCTRRLITFGTPYSGSVNALDFLANGFRRGWGPFTVDLSDTVRSFTSVYQLLPSFRCLAGAGDQWLNLDEVDWSGTGIDHERLVDAIEMARDLRATVDSRLAAGAGNGYDIRAVIGDFQRTKWAARRLPDGRIEPMWMRTLTEDGGDGTVPRVSAMPHELLSGWHNATFVGQRHASLQNDGPVLDHVAGLLRIRPTGSVPIFADVESLSLEVDDVPLGEPLEIRAATRQPGAVLTAAVEEIATGAVRHVRLSEGSTGWHEADVEGLADGDYRVTVTAPGAHPVTEVVGVIDVRP
jgi:pimeloyl-ACP methyl ester carboxylesterase